MQYMGDDTMEMASNGLCTEKKKNTFFFFFYLSAYFVISILRDKYIIFKCCLKLVNTFIPCVQ